MKTIKSLSTLLVLFLLFGTPLSSQDIKVFDTYDEFEGILQLNNDTTYVINFWATWCAPCIKELPYFEELNNSNEDKLIKVILVSLDFKNQLESRLRPFVEKHQLSSDVVHLADAKVNSWIDRVDPSWSGSIPATYIYKGEKKKFIEKEFHSKDEIIEEVNSLNKI